ncbi:alpha/beta fold hydrolase [Staphylococcus simulans]
MAVMTRAKGTREMYALETDQAVLRYDMIGQGPILLFIPGASGINDSYIEGAQALKQDYTVILPDRRGYGASELTAPLPASIANPKDTYRLKQDVQDMKAILESITDQPVTVFATDTGAAAALQFALDYPEWIETLLLHEPLNVSVLPDAEAYASQAEQIVRTAMIEGVPAAMRQYESMVQPTQADMNVLVENTIAPCAVCSPDTAQLRSRASTEIWLQYELRQYMNYSFVFTQDKALATNIIVAQGEDSKGSLGYEAARYFSHVLKAPMVQVPGGHYGYAQQPEAFAQAVKALLTK